MTTYTMDHMRKKDVYNYLQLALFKVRFMQDSPVWAATVVFSLENLNCLGSAFVLFCTCPGP